MHNVPDDWNMYWYTCSACGSRYHASEGGCECEEAQEEDRENIMIRLMHPEMKVCGLTVEKVLTSVWAGPDDLRDTLQIGDMEYRLYITEHDGCDELVFTAKSWDYIKNKVLKLSEDPKPPIDL